MTNTEKPSTKAELKKQGAPAVQKESKQPVTAPAKDDKKNKETPKKEDTQKGTSKKVITKPKVKKSEAVVNAHALPISTKYSIKICKFIKGKRTGEAIRDLEAVIAHKKAVPMNNMEIPHKPGKGMSAGRYPEKAAKHFINLIKTLVSNATVNEIDDPIISEAIANLASRPYGKFGRVRKKRTHVKIVAKEMKKKNTKQKEYPKGHKKESKK